VPSDQVAVPSAWRSGARWAVATTRARATASSVARRPRPGAIASAARHSLLQRRTSAVTALPLAFPARRAASAKLCPCATATSAVARRT
jgi:hypothetical protein